MIAGVLVFADHMSPRPARFNSRFNLLDQLYRYVPPHRISSLRSRRLEIVATRKNARERRRHACLPRARPLLPSPCYAGYAYRVGFLRCFGLRTGIHFAHFGLESGMVFEELRERMKVFIVSLQMSKKDGREICEFEMDLKNFCV